MTVFLPIWVIFMCVFHGCVNIIITCLPWSSGYIQNKEVKINHVFKNDKNTTDHQKRSIMTNIQLNHLSNKKALKWLTSTSLVYQWVDAFSDSIRSIITVSWSAGGQPVHMQGRCEGFCLSLSEAPWLWVYTFAPSFCTLAPLRLLQ